MKKRYLPLLLLCGMFAFGAFLGCNEKPDDENPGKDDDGIINPEPPVDNPPVDEVTETDVTYVFVNGDERLSYQKTQAVGSALTYTHDLISYTDSWYLNADLTSPVETCEGEAMTVYTAFSDIVVRCMFRTSDSSQSQTVSGTKREGITLIAGFTVEGYDFLGWTNGGNTYAAGEAVSLETADPNVPLIFVASLKLKTFSVTYKSEGAADETVTQEYGSAVKDAPTRTGYKFVCWLDEGGNPVENIVEECTLTAQWEVITYSVTVYSYAADGTEQSTTNTYNYNATVTLNAASRDGYDFSHWTISVDGGEAEVFNGTEYLLGTHYEAESIVFRPVYTGTVRTVTLVGAEKASVDLLVGTNLYEGLKEAEGANFSGWFYDAALTNPVGAQDVLTYFEVGEVYTIYHSAGKTYTVTFTVDGVETKKEYSFNTSFLAADNGVKEGHTFLGWFTAAEGGEEVTGVFASAITVYAHFTINSYTVTFDADGGSNPPASITKEYGSEITVPEADGMIRLYSTFSHWEDESGTKYNAGDKFTLKGDITIKAVWNRTEITVRLTDWDGYEMYTQVVYAGDEFHFDRDALALWLGIYEFEGFTYKDNLFGYTYTLKENTIITDEVKDITATAYYVNRYTGDVLYNEVTAEIMKHFLYFDRGNNTYMVSGKAGVAGLTGNSLNKLFRDGITGLPKSFALPVTWQGRLVTAVPDSSTGSTGAFAVAFANNQNSGGAVYDGELYSVDTLYIPSQYSVIGAYAFSGQTHTKIYFGKGSLLTELTESNGMTGNANVVYGFPRGITVVRASGFAGRSQNFEVYYDDMTQMKELPSSFVYIYQSALSGNNIFEKVDLSNVTYLGRQVFDGKTNIKEVIIGSKLTTVPYGIFWRCEGITKITIPAQITTIEANAFANCSNLTKLEFAQNSKLTIIGDNAFWRTGMTEVTIPEGVTSIGAGAFGYNHNYEDSSNLGVKYDLGYMPLEKVTLPSTLVSIGGYAFASTLLKEIKFPSTLTTIGEFAFYDTPNLKKIELNEGLKLLSNGAFRKKKNYEYDEKDKFVLTIPSTVEIISGKYHEGAFESFFNITGITFAVDKDGKSALRAIKGYAFADLRNLEGALVFPEGLAQLDAYVFPMQAPATGFYDDDLDGPKVTSITIPSTVYSIGYECFKNFAELKELKFVDNLGTVEVLDSKQLSNNVIEVTDTVPAYLSISAAAFRCATSLKSLDLPSQLSQLTFGSVTDGIYNGAFYGCSALETITFRGRTDGKADIACRISAVSFEECSSVAEIYIYRNTRIEIVAVGFSDVDAFFLRSVERQNRVYVYCPAADLSHYRNAAGWHLLNYSKS